jgi:hypothetical protein
MYLVLDNKIRSSRHARYLQTTVRLNTEFDDYCAHLTGHENNYEWRARGIFRLINKLRCYLPASQGGGSGLIPDPPIPDFH